MEHTRKLALVDPRQLQQYDYLPQQHHQQQQHQQQQQQRYEQHLEYKDIQKLPVLRKKTDLSLDIKHILDDDTISDDIKAKLYRHALDRYLKVSTNVTPKYTTESTVAINPLQLPLQRKVLSTAEEGRKTKKKKTTAARQQQQQQQQQQRQKQKKKKKSIACPSSSS